MILNSSGKKILWKKNNFETKKNNDGCQIFKWNLKLSNDKHVIAIKIFETIVQRKKIH